MGKPDFLIVTVIAAAALLAVAGFLFGVIGVMA